MPDTHRIFVACAPGLEGLLADEARGLGLGSPHVEPGGVSLIGGADLAPRANLGLGLGLRVQLVVHEGAAHDFRALAGAMARLPWEAWLTPRLPCEVRATCRKSRLYHSGAVAERVLDAIDRRLGGLPQPGGPHTQRVLARLDRDRLTVSIDTTGDPLHRRGYRLATGKAPLREDIARALLVLSRWDRRSPLIDPFAGSGTIPIEAAWLARGLPPGHLRAFAFMSAPGFDAAGYEALRAAEVARATAITPPIFASDRDPGAVEATRANAARAGVEGIVSAQLSLGASRLAQSPPRAPGAVVTNPPWGHRVSRPGPLRDLYASLGAHLRSLGPGYRVALAVAAPALARLLGLPLEQRGLTDQGGVKVRLYTTPP